MSNSVIPFGKHKGQEVIEVLEKDPQYLDWLRMQPGIAEKYPALFQVIINHGADPSETPEHNALQARLLEPEIRKSLALLYAPKNWAESDYGLEFEVNGADALLTFYGGVWHETYAKSTAWDVRILIECKPLLGEDYPAVLRQIKAFKDRQSTHKTLLIYSCADVRSVPLEAVRAIFKASAIEVISIDEIENG